MARLRHGIKLFGEIWGFARHHKAYWIIPLALFLGFAALVVVVGQGGAPLIYTLF